jgi:hypothetical protein
VIISTGKLLVEHFGPLRQEMIKTPQLQKSYTVLRSEKDIRLRIDLLEAQSSFAAKMLTRAISKHDEAVFAEYAKRLAVFRGRIEELLWVLGEKNTIGGGAAAAAGGQSVLDMRVTSKNNNDDVTVSVREIIEKLRRGELRMDELSADTQTMVRKGALEMKNSSHT